MLPTPDKVRQFVTPQGCVVTSRRRLDLRTLRVCEHVTVEVLPELELIEDGQEWPQPRRGPLHVW